VKGEVLCGSISFWEGYEKRLPEGTVTLASKGFLNSLGAFVFLPAFLDSSIRKEGIMKKLLVFMIGLSLLVFILSGVSYGWQGRMGGMGDPYGLISDESDFLIHPAKIAQGEGVRFYGDYRFTYTGVTDWDYELDRFNIGDNFLRLYDFETSGEQYSHDALLGAAFPLGPGRMGVFFSYDGTRGAYDGYETLWDEGDYEYYNYDLTNDLDAFALRFLYGLPVMGMDLGVELGMAYRNEKQESWIQEQEIGGTGTQNSITSWRDLDLNLFPFMIPYDSDYWELLWKAGIGKAFDSMDITVSLRGGYIVCSDNHYEYLYQEPVSFNGYNVDMDGNVTGWRIGSDIWFRYGLGEGLALPFLVSIDYAEKKRDGDGIGTGIIDTGELYDYAHNEKTFDLKAGGGLEKEFDGDVIVGVNLYYNYLQQRDGVCFTITHPLANPHRYDNSELPSHREHMAILRLAGEKEFSPTVALRMGLNVFYGWVQEDFEFTYNNYVDILFTDDISLDGSHWGIGASIGGTIQFNSFTLEPFVNGGWQAYDLDGDGDRIYAVWGIDDLYEMKKSRSEWSIGGGMSILFDLP
jgi:hypothetical protein